VKGFELRTKRLTLKPIRMADLSAIYENAKQETVALNAGFPLPKSILETRAYVKTHIAAWKLTHPPILTFSMFTKKGEWIGGINLRWAHPGVGELGYSVHPPHWGNGYAPEASRKLSDWGFRQGAHRIQATCWVGNKRSARVLKKIGMKREGILRDYFRRGDWVRSEYMWAMTRSDWKSSK